MVNLTVIGSIICWALRLRNTNADFWIDFGYARWWGVIHLDRQSWQQFEKIRPLWFQTLASFPGSHSKAEKPGNEAIQTLKGETYTSIWRHPLNLMMYHATYMRLKWPNYGEVIEMLLLQWYIIPIFFKLHLWCSEELSGVYCACKMVSSSGWLC